MCNHRLYVSCISTLTQIHQVYLLCKPNLTFNRVMFSKYKKKNHVCHGRILNHGRARVLVKYFLCIL